MTHAASTPTRHAVLARIRETGVIPVIRADSSDTALRIAEALVGAGMRLIEVTMTVPGATQVMTALANRFGRDIDLGAGTITSSSMLEAAVDAGCSFLVTPALIPALIAQAQARDVALISGAFTPTEILSAHQAGADLVKVFPVSAVGGPSYIRALRGPFPAIGLVATGGVTLETVAEYFQAGVAAVGVGGELISRAAVQAGNFAALGAAARAFVEAVRRPRPVAAPTGGSR